MKKTNSRLGFPDRAPTSPNVSESIISEKPTVKEEIITTEAVIEDGLEKSNKKAKSKKSAEVVVENELEVAVSEPEVAVSEPEVAAVESEVAAVEQSTEVVAED
jgi:hypothetical protein